MRVAAFVEVLRAATAGIVQFGPWIRASLDLVADQKSRGRAIADPPAIESGGDIQSLRLLFGFADIRHAVRSVVVLVEPSPCRLPHWEILSGPLVQLTKARGNVALLSRNERRSEHDEQRAVSVPSGPYRVGGLIDSDEHSLHGSS